MKIITKLLTELSIILLLITSTAHARLPGFDFPVAGDQVTSLAAGYQDSPATSKGSLIGTPFPLQRVR